MNHTPALWVAAYGDRGTALTRLTARALLRVRAFLRALAELDHQPFTSL